MMYSINILHIFISLLKVTAICLYIRKLHILFHFNYSDALENYQKPYIIYIFIMKSITAYPTFPITNSISSPRSFHEIQGLHFIQCITFNRYIPLSPRKNSLLHKSQYI